MTVCDVKQCRVPLDSGEKQRALSIQGRTYVVCVDCLKVFEEFMERALEGDKPKAGAHFRLVSVSPVEIVDNPGPVWLPSVTVLPVPLVPAPSTTSPAPTIHYYGGGQALSGAGGDIISGTFVSNVGAIDTPS